MAGQTLLWDSRIRTIAVMIPTLAVMGWLAQEIASENFVAPLLTLGAFCILVFFTVFMKTIRFESVVLCFLLIGYLVGNRGFAELTPIRPLFPGELGLTIIVSCLLVRFALTRELPDLSGWLARMIFIFCLFAAIRLSADFRIYGIDALRDSAMVYYSLYFFFGRQLVAQPASKLMLEKCLKFSFTALVPLALISRFAPDALGTTAGITFLFQKDDLLTTFTAVGVFVLYTRPNMYRWNWVRRAMILFFIVYVAIGAGRASLLSLMFGTILLLVAGRKKFLVYPALAIFLGLTVLAGFVSYSNSQEGGAASVFVEKIVSMVDFTGQSSYNSEYGELKASTNEFRRRLWESFVDDTNAHSPTFGRGFGYDFISHFETTFQRGGWIGLRSAHNFYITLYGRMGLVGIFVFGIITVQIIFGGIAAALAVRDKLLPLSDLSYWCGAWAILVSSSVGVVLEGPIGAVVFWSFLGVAVETAKAASAIQRTAARNRFIGHEAPRAHPERGGLTYGAT